MITLKKLPARPENWDALIKAYPTKTLFHESAWLDHVLSIHPKGRIDYFEINDGKEIIGYHCGLRIKKMGIPIHGSPLGGTGTNYMGPLVSEKVDQLALIKAISRAAGIRNFLHLELSHFWLDPEIMRKAGFQIHRNVTHLIKLPGTVDDAWQNMKGPARNRVRKAEKNGLIVEVAENSEIVKNFFEQFIEVYGKQNMVTPFGIERPQSLYEHLLPAKRLLPLQIRSEDSVIAAGLFPYDENCIYFWGAASWLKYQSLSPNELLHWSVIKFAVENGIKAYNMCGGYSQFKDKFGGEDVAYNHYSKSMLPFLQKARRIYKYWHHKSLKKSD